MRSPRGDGGRRRAARCAIVLGAAFCLAWQGPISAAVTSPPPASVIFVPGPNAWSVAKHPSLPVLYVGCESYSGSKNLLTYRLNLDGSIAVETRRLCDDYFSADGKTPSFPHRIRVPAVNATNRVLYLSACPITLNSSQTFSQTNNFEFAAVALDEQGQPARRLRLFNSDSSGQQGLVGIRYEPALRQLFLNYYSTLNWLDLDEQGLPRSTQSHYVVNVYMIGSWEFIPEWRRFYFARLDSRMVVFRLGSDNVTPEFTQTFDTCRGPGPPAQIEVSDRYHKAYVLDTQPEQELIVFSLTSDGRVTGLPRRFGLGPTTLFRCDFKAGRLYAFGKDVLRIFQLDADGLPLGPPQICAMACGEIHSICFDDSTGRIYVASEKPPLPR